MNTQKNVEYKGGCHCGSVRYCAKGTPVIVAHCHCEDCQRLSGAGHSTGAMFAAADVKLTGEVSQHSYAAANGNRVTKSFCSNCGSSLFGRNSGSSDYLTLSLGTFDDSSMLEPQVTIFANNKKPWDVMDETLPTFDTQPDWKPVVA